MAKFSLPFVIIILFTERKAKSSWRSTVVWQRRWPWGEVSYTNWIYFGLHIYLLCNNCSLINWLLPRGIDIKMIMIVIIIIIIRRIMIIITHVRLFLLTPVKFFSMGHNYGNIKRKQPWQPPRCLLEISE